MSDMRIGAAAVLLRATLPYMALRLGLACLLPSVASVVTYVAVAKWGALSPGVAAAVALGLIALAARLLWPWIAVYVTLAHLRAMTEIAEGRSDGPVTLVADWARIASDSGSAAAMARLLTRMRGAHRDLMGLVQGLTSQLPWPVPQAGPLASRLWLALLSRLLADLSTAAALGAAPLGDMAASQVALTAERLRDLVRALAGPSRLVALVILGGWAAVQLGLIGLWPTAPVPALVVLPLLWTAVLWRLLGAPVLAALALTARVPLLRGEVPTVPWLSRLETSSPAFRAAKAWPGSPPAA